MTKAARVAVVFVMCVSLASGLAPSRRRALVVLRGGGEAVVEPGKRSLVRRWLDALRAFLGSFFDPSFGGVEAPPPVAPAAAPKAKAMLSKGAPRRAKKVTVADLQSIEGGTVQSVGTEADFARKIASQKLTCVDFWATWCGPCQQMKPKFAAISDKHAKRAAFLAVDVDKAKPIAQKYAVSSMPTFVFFKGGKEVSRFSGADESKLEATIARLA
mmetsp:Transcript_33310/g.106345  ORF Transcript_33310/g.106345 Transcript_33310/m.106345 type:complete len:215 (-) Transcript_33310:105-749(-)